MKLTFFAFVLAITFCSSVHAQIELAEQFCRPLQAGALAPAVKVRNLKDKLVSLNDIRNGQPTVIVFFRGTWCPLCTLALSHLQQAQAELSQMGFQIVAISSESPAELAKFAPAIDPDWVRPEIVKDETGRQRFERVNLPRKALSYKLYCDPDADAASAFGVAFHKKLVGTDYERLKKIPLIQTKGGKPWLPLPSAFIVDKSGRIRFVDLNRTESGAISADYQRRIKARDLINAAKKVMAEKNSTTDTAR